jgi:hypothetical protein
VLTSLNLADNKIGKTVGWRAACATEAWKFYHSNGSTQDEKPDVMGKPVAIIAIANAIRDMGMMTKLNLSKNGLLTQEGGRALGGMLKANTILKELDVSDSGNGMSNAQRDCSGFATALSEGLAGNGAISTVIVNTFRLPIQEIKSKAELDFSGKKLKVEDVIIIAALIPSNVSHKPYISLLSLISLSVPRGL